MQLFVRAWWPGRTGGPGPWWPGRTGGRGPRCLVAARPAALPGLSLHRRAWWPGVCDPVAVPGGRGAWLTF